MERPSVAECRRLLAEADQDALEDLCTRFADDERKGVREAVQRAGRRREFHLAEVERLAGMHALQRSLHARGFAVVAGVDEVGRGALAGPVSAGAAVLEVDTFISGLDDSKRLTPAQREAIARDVRAHAIAVAVAHVDATEIDRLGIVRATHEAMRRAIEDLGVAVSHVLVDGNDPALGAACTAVVGGDSKCAAIAAASVIAKVARDRLMVELAPMYDGYQLDVHKGYSTPEHLLAIRELGPTDIHRRSFEPCRQDATLF